MNQIIKHLSLSLLCTILILTPALAAPPSEDSLITIALDSSAKPPSRESALRQLKTIGSARAAEALAPLLIDPTMSHLARYALESIPDPAASKSLIAALEKSTDPLVQIGLINSLAVRSEDAAVPAISALFASANNDVRLAAAKALGRIATPQATAALQALKPDAVPGEIRLDALLRCADRLAAAVPADAAKIYRSLFQSAASPHKAAALIGLVTRAGGDSRDVVSALDSPDPRVRQAAVALVARENVPNILPAVADAMKNLQPSVQSQILAVLIERNDRAAVGIARTSLKSPDAPVRIAAIRLLAVLGEDADAPGLLALATAPDEIGAAAREALAILPAPQMDDLLLTQLAAPEIPAKKLAIDLLAARGHRGLLDKLYDEKLFADNSLAASAGAAIRSLGARDEFSRALPFAMRLPSDRRAPLAGSLGALAQRMENSAQATSEIQKALSAAPPADRALPIGLLPAVQCPQSMKSLEYLSKDASPDIRKEALRALGRWDTAAVAEILLASAKTDSDPTARILATRSLLFVLQRPRSVPQPQVAIALLRRAMETAERIDEKKAILSALPSFKCPDAIIFAESLTSDPDLGPLAKQVLTQLRSK